MANSGPYVISNVKLTGNVDPSEVVAAFKASICFLSGICFKILISVLFFIAVHVKFMERQN